MASCGQSGEPRIGAAGPLIAAGASCLVLTTADTTDSGGKKHKNYKVSESTSHTDNFCSKPVSIRAVPIWNPPSSPKPIRKEQPFGDDI